MKTIVHTKDKNDLDELLKVIPEADLGEYSIVHSVTKRTVEKPNILTGGKQSVEVEGFDPACPTALAAAAAAGNRILTTGLYLDRAAELGELMLVTKNFGKYAEVKHIFAKNIVDAEAFNRLKESDDFKAAFTPAEGATDTPF